MKKPNGSVERWTIEGGPPNALFRRGFTRDSLPAGIEILVEGFQAKDGSLKGNGREVTFADGRRLFLGSSGTGARKTARKGAGNDIRRMAAVSILIVVAGLPTPSGHPGPARQHPNRPRTSSSASPAYLGTDM